MTPADLQAAQSIADSVHAAFPEDPAVFAERLALFPAGCFLLHGPAGPAGYLISHPWHAGQPPALNTLLGAIPASPGTYYLHDLALLPTARGHGAARAILAKLPTLAAAFPEMSLVAVGNSPPFWRAQGFTAVHAPHLAAKLASYGPGTVFMRRATAA